tara:strand:- start:121 stop:375 length:255 start_codon:yes stop_codon:yes gene_type:complete
MNILIDFGDDQSVRKVYVKQLTDSDNGKEYAVRFRPTSEYTMFYNEAQLNVAIEKANEKLSETDDDRPWSEDLSECIAVDGSVD